MGGLARRVSYIKAFRHRSNGEVPALYLDAGNLFTDEKYNNDRLPPEVIAKNRWVVKGYSDFHHDAANISYADLPYVAELLKKDGYDQRVKDYPFIKKLTSANIHPADDSRIAPAPYLIREVTMKRGGAERTLRVGIVGLTEPGPMMLAQKVNQFAGFIIEDAMQAAKNILPEVKNKADIIVVLAYMAEDQAKNLARAYPEINTIIVARQLSTTNDPQHENHATIVTANNQTKFLGELRYYFKSDGSIENQTNRFVGMDSTIPDDESALETVTNAHTDFTNEQNKSAQTNVQPTSLLGGTNNSLYVGDAQCGMCHQEEHKIWEKSGHSHAMATLERKGQQFDTECVGCHVVGFQRGGFQSQNTTPQLANVQCEACHGPGKAHAEKPQKGYGFMQTPQGCVQCHTKSNSPDFDFSTYWPKVKHNKTA